ncbi:MAG TPA: tRNA (adenosine(37)-N6)-threonylcarbamoyltransferase complex dimerization subunit type 1 TsaB [Ktedonobacteraceae bacterium]|nr:tRNA (adenosine(37)-N6)-threonylcarbamoyltransferase complex dimerization subunit type 1 TsaB [Ktedonobacteraceae bacterium]
MLLLALDTSTRQASVALCDEQTLYGEYTWQIGNNHSVELLERIQRLVVVDCGSSLQVIDGVTVAIGPGSFNGVRVAVATAKALAFALQKPLVGVSTLEIIAAQQDQWRGPVCSILEAGRSELYAACYLFDERDTNGDITYHIRQLSEYLMLSPQQLVNYLNEQMDQWAGVPGKRQVSPILFCGELSEITRQVIYEQMQGKSLFIDNLQATRRASSLALLAIQRLYEGRIEDPMLLEPLYLRRPSITTSTRKQPLLGQKPNQSSDLNQTEREEGALRH